MSDFRPLLVELFVEELPPKALKKLGDSFANSVADSLRQQGLLQDNATVQAYASPRRLAVGISAVASQAADKPISQKLMPVAVGLDANGQATPALLKKFQALGLEAQAVSQLKRVHDGKAEVLFLDSIQAGATLTQGLQTAVDLALGQLPIPKVMTYQLADGWSSVNFVRPAHGLMVLHGSDIVPIQTLGLTAGRETHGHRFEALVDPIVVPHAQDYSRLLAQQGAVIASFEERRQDIADQLHANAQQAGLTPIQDDSLLDEVTALVERPHVLTCQFEKEFLQVPQECLILTMKANQKYFPLLDAEGRLTHQFLVVSNINPADPSAVIGGNERVVRPRLADAKFFFDQDRKKTLASRVPELAKVVYHGKLGSQGQRSERVAHIARLIVQQLQTSPGWNAPDLAQHVEQAAQLAKTDLLTDMVGEFPELQGIMGAYYARHEGLANAVAEAIEDHYKPRFAGDSLPRQPVGVILALADKLETLVGLFGIGQLPTGDKDPYALRRHALGVIRLMIEKDLPLSLPLLLKQIVPVFGDLIQDPSEALLNFMQDRLAVSLKEQGFSAQEVDAVLALAPERLTDVPRRLEAVRAFAALPEAPSLAAANKRVSNILKKNAQALTGDTRVTRGALQEPQEIALYDAMMALQEDMQARLARQDYTGQLQLLATLHDPVDAFFEHVMVMAEDPGLRQQRLALLQQLQSHMMQVADLSRLAH